MSYVLNTSTIEENFAVHQNSSHGDNSSTYEWRIKSHFEAAANPGHSTTFRIIAIAWFSFCFIVGCIANVTVIKTFVQKKTVSRALFSNLTEVCALLHYNSGHLRSALCSRNFQNVKLRPTSLK